METRRRPTPVQAGNTRCPNAEVHAHMTAAPFLAAVRRPRAPCRFLVRRRRQPIWLGCRCAGRISCGAGPALYHRCCTARRPVTTLTVSPHSCDQRERCWPSPPRDPCYTNSTSGCAGAAKNVPCQRSCGAGQAERPAGFGALLKQYREGRGLSQEMLAERAGLSADAIGALENGRRQAPYRGTVALLARALDLTAAEQAALEASVDRRRASPPPGRGPAAAAHRHPAP